MTPDELTILSSDGGELKEIMSVGGNFLRGIITTTQACSGQDGNCSCKGCKPCCGESCLLLYDDIDFTFDNILLLCDSIFKWSLNVQCSIIRTVASFRQRIFVNLLVIREKMHLLAPMMNVVVLRNSTNCTEIESSCLLAVFEKIVGWW
jgi:hypothetical protein